MSWQLIFLLGASGGVLSPVIIIMVMIIIVIIIIIIMIIRLRVIIIVGVLMIISGIDNSIDKNNNIKRNEENLQPLLYMRRILRRFPWGRPWQLQPRTL